MKKVNTVRKLQQKYGIAMGLSMGLVRLFIKSPVFRVSDISIMLFKATKANKSMLDKLMDIDLESSDIHFDMPVCCIQGELDYQTATPLATAYYEKVQAPRKQIHVIPGAGHATMVDQPELFADALEEALTLLD